MSASFRPDSLVKLILAWRRRVSPDASGTNSRENDRLKELTARADEANATGHIDEARRSYEEVLHADSKDLYVIYQLATLLHERRMFAEAAKTCDSGLAVQPDQIGLLSRRAGIASDVGDHRRALTLYLRIRELAPEFKDIDAKLADQYSFLGHGPDAVAAFDRAIARDPNSPRLQSDRLFVMNYFKLVDRETLFEEHRRWGAWHEARLSNVRLPWPNDRNRDRKLRVGYVSADLRHHAVAFFIEGVLRSHDRQQFENECFDASPYAEDAVTLRLRRYVDQWHRVSSMTDEQVADLVRSRKIDILVDLSGHTARNRLLVFARKPAPVQVSWFGYMNTTGLSTIDYRITDGYMDPPGESERYYTENLFRIQSMACFSPHPDSPPVSALPALSAGTFTFASVNQWTKISEDVKALWGSILRDAPSARLLAIVRGGEFPGVREDVTSQFVKFGASASQVVVYPTQPIRDFLGLFSQVDVALDPFPYGGGTSSLHTIWMGVPIVTLEGESEMSRAASGIVRAVGLDDWVAGNVARYREIALEAVAEPKSLIPVRAGLRERMRASPLTDAATLTRNVENAYRAMWHAYSSR